jgi:hypothetical protein
VRDERLAASLETVSKAFGLPKVVTPAEVFTADYLPDAAVRKLP